ncbi:L,D-transpeptidase family protein [Extibacter muris]|uniref:L,D-transpeptidase family protein n=1 Tax=Extibacter muris TaxID=1796622 RepID=UPI001D06C48F|nr:L,D-transpeptidase family protein [Extibacter muris]MCB6201567.1 L,D-transpeptidase family protein [Extibacter muris]MCQ4662893.1 L,D-transpeptidase family protein [Extibacter muris]MCQ4694191.1 L,D-transpeptidase family protein [Extibacter muris]
MKKNIKRICILILAVEMFSNVTTLAASDSREGLSVGLDDREPEVGKSNVWTGDISTGDRAYIKEDGLKALGLCNIDGATYYFGKDGYVQTGWLEVDGCKYYFDNQTGQRYENMRSVIDNVEYDFDENGQAEEVLEDNDDNGRKEVLDENQNPSGSQNNTLSETGNGQIPSSTIGKDDTGWKEENGKKYYILPDGSKRVGWLSFGKVYYYCGSDGAIVTGMQKISGKWYFFNEEGIRQNDWIENDGKRYYGLADGSLCIGWLSFGKTYYYCGSDGAIVTGMQKIGGRWYYFNEAGVRQCGWIENDGKRYYGLADGSLQVGWIWFGKTRYYCDSNGAIVTGPYGVNGVSYYFDDNGVLSRAPAGWQTIGGKRYYGMPDGCFCVGWLSFGNTYFYCDSMGAIVTGPYSVDGTAYYFNAEGILEKASSGWQMINGKKYYGMPDGHFRVGWLSFGNIYYYCGRDGAVVTGFQNINGKRYFFDSNGERQYGWIVTGGKKYYGMPDGSLNTGWLWFGKTRYYCDNTGAIVTGPYGVGGKAYYFNDEGLQRPAPAGWQTINGKKYYGMPDGCFCVGWLSFGKTYYYCGSSGAIVSGEYAVDGILYSFDEFGVMQIKGGWGNYNNNVYYINPSTGFPYKGWVYFGKTRYYANSKGIMVSGWQYIGGSYYYFYPDSKKMAYNTVIGGYTLGADGKRLPKGLGEMSRKAQSYYSPTGYLVLVDRKLHKVGVFAGKKGGWTNMFYWDCGDGAPSTPTVSGVFNVGIRGYYFDSGSARCFWYTQFYGNYLFHSVLCYKDGRIMDGRVGMALSHGCVRLQISNAKWIYDNIPYRTTVVVY